MINKRQTIAIATLFTISCALQAEPTKLASKSSSQKEESDKKQKKLILAGGLVSTIGSGLRAYSLHGKAITGEDCIAGQYFGEAPKDDPRLTKAIAAAPAELDRLYGTPEPSSEAERKKFEKHKIFQDWLVDVGSLRTSTKRWLGAAASFATLTAGFALKSRLSGLSF